MDLFFHFSPTPILICIAYILAVCCRTVLSNLFVMRAKLKIKFVGCKISLPPPVPPACHHGETSRDVWHDWFHCKMPLLVFPSWRGGGKGVCCAPPPLVDRPAEMSCNGTQLTMAWVGGRNCSMKDRFLYWMIPPLHILCIVGRLAETVYMTSFLSKFLC